jgi:hypothetical protein
VGTNQYFSSGVLHHKIPFVLQGVEHALAQQSKTCSAVAHKLMLVIRSRCEVAHSFSSHVIPISVYNRRICWLRDVNVPYVASCFTGSALNVNERNGEAFLPMGEYGIALAARSEFLPSRFVCVYTRVWHSVRWLENVRYVT